METFSFIYNRLRRPITGLEWPRRFQEDMVHIFHEKRHRMMVRLSALSTGRLYPSNCSLYSFLLKVESTQERSAKERVLYQLKNFFHTISDRTSDFPIYSTEP